MLENLIRTALLQTLGTSIPTIFWDDCEGHIAKWQVTGTGSDYSAAYTNDAPHAKSKSLHLKTRATTPTASDKIGITKGLWIPPTKKVRLQLLYSVFTPAVASYFNVSLIWHDGTNLWTATINLLSTGTLVKYWNNAGAWTTITGWNFNYTKYTENLIDLSVNLDTHNYGRLQVNHQVTDLSAQTIKSTASALVPFLVLGLELTTAAAAQSECDIQEIVVLPDAA